MADIVASWGAAGSAPTPYRLDRASDRWRSEDRRYKFNGNYAPVHLRSDASPSSKSSD